MLSRALQPQGGGLIQGSIDCSFNASSTLDVWAMLRAAGLCIRTVFGSALRTGVMLCVLQTSLPAQRPGAMAGDSVIHLGPDRSVEINTRGIAVVEPHLAADPREPNHLIGGAFLVARMGDPRDPKSESSLSCIALSSFDGGQTWARHDFPQPGCLDAWTAILPDGRAVFLGISRGGLFAAQSRDGGRTWSDSVVRLGPGDHGSLMLDTTGGPFAGSVYAAWWNMARDGRGVTRSAVLVARSRDGAATFAQPTPAVAWNVPTITMPPVVLPSGTLIVPFNSLLPKLSPTWIVRSNDGGRTFSSPSFVTDVCGRGWSELAIDASTGPFRGRLYWVCSDSANVYLIRSGDGGETWDSPSVVSAGADPAGNPVLAINQQGVLGISWYDARDDPRGYRGTFRCQRVMFSASLDGGRTFEPAVRVSSAENCSNSPANGEAGMRWNAGGDYFGLAAAADGRFHLLWADSREGIYQLRTAAVIVSGTALAVPKAPAK